MVAYSASAPLALGVGEDGTEVTVKLDGGASSLLIGGSPGSGKSCVHWVCAHHCLDPDAAALTALIDLKGGVEMGIWEPSAGTFATDLETAVEALATVEAEMDRRLAVMDAERKRTGRPVRQWAGPPATVIVDEAAELLRVPKEQRELSQAAERSLARLVSRGRAARCRVVLATQKPTSDTLPTAIRDQMGLRLCFRVGTRQQAEAVLGPEALAAGADPTSIPVDAPGLGYLVAEDGIPTRLRTYYADDTVVTKLARLAAAAAGSGGTSVDGKGPRHSNTGGLACFQIQSPSVTSLSQNPRRLADG